MRSWIEGARFLSLHQPGAAAFEMCLVSASFRNPRGTFGDQHPRDALSFCCLCHCAQPLPSGVTYTSGRGPDFYLRLHWCLVSHMCPLFARQRKELPVPGRDYLQSSEPPKSLRRLAPPLRSWGSESLTSHQTQLLGQHMLHPSQGLPKPHGGA